MLRRTLLAGVRQKRVLAKKGADLAHDRRGEASPARSDLQSMSELMSDDQAIGRSAVKAVVNGRVGGDVERQGFA